MNDEKKQIKIKFKTAIILIILLLSVTVVFSVMFVKNNQQNIANTINTVQNDKPNEINEEIIKGDFSLAFLKLENKNENMIYSPLSISYALKMLNEGAEGNTKEQIENVIKELELTKYDNIENVLSLANCIYVRDDFSKYVKQDFKSRLIEKYNAEINYDSFENANNINSWIENKTLGIIKDMIKDSTVQNKETVMLLINALGIDMEWEEAFDAAETNGKEFNLQDGSKKIVTTMHKKETMNDSTSYYKDNDITALAMDLKKYDDIQLQFVAIMPDKNLANYIETFTIKDFNNIINKLTLASKTKNGVDISIPSFSFEYDLKLKDNLEKLGIKDAFNSKLADFSNISDEELFVSDAIHKANIDFTEKGIKAAAATVIYLTEGMAIEEDKPIEIKIDNPFLYLIRDKNTGEIWFVGTVYEPNSWEEDKVNYQYR